MQRTQEFIITGNGNLDNTLAFTMPLLSKSESLELISSCGELGPDPSSAYFTKRTKNIAYVMCIDGQWFQLQANYFAQPHQYNDFSGGYKRYYREMPKKFLECEATQKVLFAFKSAYNIPDKEPILVQVQASHVNADNAGQCLTGQGIHSDGADRAMILCLARENIMGAENAIYADLKGNRALMNPFRLEAGHALLWHDNKVFHHVGPTEVADPKSEGTRTVLIAHYPATHYLTGKANPNNVLGTNKVESSKRLRDQKQATAVGSLG
ncbi:MAG: 2OG-Fe dioxygenase family protein [Cyanothece sp. SIO1E1]|nr:2OG-Fe dioxygenase family protein [Cyanothece sp. SIO1E1]